MNFHNMHGNLYALENPSPLIAASPLEMFDAFSNAYTCQADGIDSLPPILMLKLLLGQAYMPQHVNWNVLGQSLP